MPSNQLRRLPDPSGSGRWLAAIDAYQAVAETLGGASRSGKMAA
jgi:hypothetical protein